MKTLRTPDDICLLCQTNKSDKKSSHYTPAGIIKRVIGERNYEELYSFNSNRASTSVFFGRSNLLNTDPTIKNPGHVEDYIFCTDCENKLAVIEGECNNKLIILSDDLVKSNLTINKTKIGNKYFSFKKPNRNVLIVYFYSIIWRLCLQQKIEFQSVFITERFQEILREIIHREIGKSVKEIERSKDFETYPNLIIVTTYHKSDHTANFINPNPTPSNPELFFVGPYNVLIFHTKILSEGFESKTGFSQTLIDNDLIINDAKESIIGIVNESIWDKVKNKLTKYESEKYICTMTVKLSNATGMPYLYAQKKLFMTANKLISQFPDDYIKCLDIAFQSLIK